MITAGLRIEDSVVIKAGVKILYNKHTMWITFKNCLPSSENSVDPDQLASDEVS